MSGSKLKPSIKLGRLFAELCGAWNLKPYWGKPTVRNFRGGGWKRDHGSRTEAHVERRGTATGPYRVRAQCSTRQHGGCIETRERVLCVAKIIDVKSAIPDQLPRGCPKNSPRRA